MSAPFTVLAVCTGNICRSPMTERLLAVEFARLAQRLGPAWAPGNGVLLRSAGLQALVGEPMTPETAALVEAAGADAAGHVARQLLVGDVTSAGLVLALTRAHRADIVTAVPLASRSTFTLPEFARVVRHLSEYGGGLSILDETAEPADFLARLVEHAALSRGIVPPPAAPEEDDVVDPYLGSSEDYARSGEQVSAAIGAIRGAFERLLPVRS